MNLMTFDAKGAFLYRELQVNVNMYQFGGFQDNTDIVCKLNKSFYGWKQLPKN